MVERVVVAAALVGVGDGGGAPAVVAIAYRTSRSVTVPSG
jgi:hypothetical protein